MKNNNEKIERWLDSFIRNHIDESKILSSIIKDSKSFDRSYYLYYDRVEKFSLMLMDANFTKISKI